MLGRLTARLGRHIGTERLIGLALLAGFAGLYVWNPYPVELVRAKTFDLYQKAKPREIPPDDAKPVVIVDLDEASQAEIGQWPWPRAILADLVDRLTALGAAAITFDIVFPEVDRMNPDLVANSLDGLDADTRHRLNELPSNDAVFARAINNGRVVLGQAGHWEARTSAERTPLNPKVAFKGPKPHPFLPKLTALVRNLPELEQAAAGHGIFSLVSEPDGIVRRVPTLFQLEGRIYPALTIEALRVGFQRSAILVETNEAGVNTLGIAPKSLFPPEGLRIPTDTHGRVWPYFSRRDPTKYISARDVLAGEVDPSRLRGRIALVGTSAIGLLDIRSTPTEQAMPGVEVHAQLIEAALTRAYLARPNYINGAELTLVVAGGLLVIWLVPLVGARWTLILFLGISGGALATSWYLFAEQRILFDAGFAVASMLVLYMLLTYVGYAREEESRRKVRSAFGHYLAPALVERLADDPDRLRLGGEKRDMTVLFCDVRGFTAMAEQLDAEALTDLINRLLTPLTDVIMRHGGTVDKYMGDCVMAFWNAPLDDPDHARNACRAALAMTELMEPLNAQLAADAAAGGRHYPPLRVGVGLNSGEVVVGNVGSAQRFDYSVLGDEVNLAARLEGQSKIYLVDVVMGENTVARAPEFATLELDLIRVKGKREAVRVYTLLRDETLRNGNAFQALKGLHGEMLAAYRGQRWDEAQEKLDACRKLIDGVEVGGLYDLYAMRVKEFMAAPPGPDWDGVHEAESK